MLTEKIEATGITLIADGEKLIVTGNLTDEQRLFIRKHKADILAELTASNDELPEDLRQMINRMAAHWSYTQDDLDHALELAAKEPDKWRRLFNCEAKQYGWLQDTVNIIRG